MQLHTLSLGPSGTSPKRRHHRHNAHTLSCHIEGRPPSHTSTTGGHREAASRGANNLFAFFAISSCPGQPMRANYSLVHAPYMSLCTKLSGVAWQGPQQEEIAKKANKLFAPPDDTNESRWLRAPRARAMCDDASSTAEASYGHCEPWNKP